ncbi:catalase [Mycolicibacterium mageritense DSM 44476 = CIP 104973]|uniref:Catalase-related peroxidase n=1 Tax=Mycolicibacterium mageritense TaxID=53462 RepID=A0ABN5YGE1_MYCME|nr:catalase family peroxidase [Mycolicibacterium mageritense]BBX36788.1 catalase-related peroxidase [Mycolicibacterium mageritense]CDO26419.1 catalase [Mycolicibacterium mageritense DSM 44476 = CIP 104973]
MGSDDDAPAGIRAALSRRGALIGLAAVGGVAVAGVGGLAEAAAWLRPDALTPDRFTDRFEQVAGRHDGFRRNHAKGLAATGTFTSTGAAAAISKAAVFREGTVPVVGRFSLSGGLPDQPDKPDTVRGLGLMFLLPDGEQWRTAMVNIPVFPDRTPQGFYERLLASRPQPDTGKPDPQAMAEFLARHPETSAAMKIIKQNPPSLGFADSTFRGLNAFRATNDQGHTTAIRWAAVPVQAARPVSGTDRNALFDALIDTVARGPVSWKLVITVADPADPTHDATIAWPPDRPTIEAGTVTIEAVHTEAPGNARDINFDPLVLPAGLGPSDDPLPRARSAVYARSFNRRAREPKSPSAVVVPGGAQ